MRETVERELKLVPGEGFTLPPLGHELPPRTFTSTYVDTDDLRLARRGITFRHRIEDGWGLWQLKLPRGASRIELEVAGPPARPPAELSDLLVAHLRGRTLGRVARLRTRRQTMRVHGAEIVDDAVAVLDGQRITMRFRELEIESLDGDEETLRRLEAELRAAGAEAGPWMPKLFRALGVELPAARAEKPPPAAPAEAVRAALVEQYERLLDHDPGTRLGTDAEDLHQLRVATRRARAFLRAARPLLAAEWADPLRAELGWLGSALGPARDLDVLLAHVQEDLAAVGASDGALAELVESLEREHEAAREAAVTALSDERYLALLDRLEAPEPRLRADGAGSLAGLWRDEWRRTRRAFAALGPGSKDDELHAARIKVKRARYAAELAAPELGRSGERFVAAAKRLQDVLGEHQDAAVAEEYIVVWAGGDAARLAAAEPLLERERERRRRARAAWPRAWKRLEQRGREARKR
jgi:CHAD domain-containing protein